MWSPQMVGFRVDSCRPAEVPCTAAFVKSRPFKRISITLIIINCALCATATADFVTEDPTMENYFDMAKDMFVYIMSVELLLQFLHHGMYLFTQGWLVFDFLIICSAWAVPNLLVVRTFRVVRTLRLASWIKDLKELVLALLLVIPKMFAIFFLLFILFLIFAILFTDLFKHTYDEAITDADYFGSLETTLFTLFQIMTLDSWSNICKQLMTEYEWAWAPFIAFVIVSSFFFLNLVIAVVCEAVTSVHRETVVKYIQEDISAATSVRDALKVEDRLEELAGSVQLLMQSQVALLDAMGSSQQLNPVEGGEQKGETASSQNQLREHREKIQAQLEGKSFASKARRGSPAMGANGSAGTSASGSISLNPNMEEEILRAAYLGAMAASERDALQPLAIRDARTTRSRLQFDADSGPSTPSFWRELGLPEEHVQRVMNALEERSIRLVQQQRQDDRPPLPPSNIYVDADQPPPRQSSIQSTESGRSQQG